MVAILAKRTYFDVKAYGASGDGVSDDGPAIRRARDALVTAGGGTLYFPQGTYCFYDSESGTVSYGEYNGITNVAALNIPSNCRVMGSGVGATTLTPGETMPLGITMLRIGTNSTVPTDVEVSHLTILGNQGRTASLPAGNGDADLINIAGSSGTHAKRIWIHHIHLDDAPSNSIDGDGVADCWITDCVIENSIEGAIHFASYGCDNIVVSRCYFYNNAWQAAVDHDSTAGAISMQANDCVVIVDNVFDYNYRGIIVNTAGGSIINGNRINAIDTKAGIWLQAADKTSVQECQFSNNLVFGGENCVLISGGRNIKLYGGVMTMASGATYSTSQAILATEFDGLDISDIMIRYTGGASPNAAIKIASTTGTKPLSIRNCVFRDNIYYGIQLASGVKGASISGNKIDVGQDGIRLEGENTSTKISRNEISATRAIFATGTASETMTVEDNLITSGTLTLGSGSGHRLRHVGSGSPESTVAAGIGSVWQRIDGGASTTLYVKESGTGNTGWKAVQTA